MTSDQVVPSNVSPEGRERLMLVVTQRDIVFNCPSCGGELVVDRAGEGLEVPCSHCGHTLTVPAYQHRAAAEADAAVSTEEASVPVFDFSALSPEQRERRLDELNHQLKENRSQDTEMRGHVSRATIELHRLQLRLKKLQERHRDIEAELRALQPQITSAA